MKELASKPIHTQEPTNKPKKNRRRLIALGILSPLGSTSPLMPTPAQGIVEFRSAGISSEIITFNAQNVYGPHHSVPRFLEIINEQEYGLRPLTMRAIT